MRSATTRRAALIFPPAVPTRCGSQRSSLTPDTNVRAAGLALDEAFEPCTNVWLGARILEADYARATRRYGPGQVALGHALSAYNSGGFFAGLAYARGVYATAARLQAGHTP